MPWHAVAFPTICNPRLLRRQHIEKKRPRAAALGTGKERQRGKEAKRQRGKEAKRQTRQEATKAERQRGREAERQRGREAERQVFGCHFLDKNFHHLNIFHFRRWISVVCTTQLPVIAVSARTTMKGAAKCDMHC